LIARLYRVQFLGAAARQIRKLPQDIQRRITAKAELLAVDPRPPGVAKLAGPDEFYRVRVGDYRIIYEIRDEILLVLVVRLGHRKDVYR
jgi:mRNA interferase RelE/StbE